jgi:xylan 1,4-beta-xylosidase
MTATYRNPVIPGFHPDPSICRVDDDYYLVTSSFEYFPGVPLFHSKDLVNWQQIGHGLTRREQLDLQGVPSSCGIYAPSLRYQEGVFYMTTTNVTGGGNFYVKTTDPRGAWSDPIWVDQPGIDPDLFFDEDGTVYYTTSWNGEAGQGVYQSRIDLATGRLLSEPRLLWQGIGGKYPEAPHLYRIGDWYYLMIAEGGTEYGHMVTIARGTSPEGPFESCPANPILTHRSLLQPIQATGHADLVQAPDGRWWMVFLGIRPVGYPNRHHLGRETFLAPVVWTEDGWPVVGHGGTVEEVMPAEGLSLQPLPAPPVRDDFAAPVLEPCWTFLRNPAPESWALAEQPGSLTLWGGAATLNDVAAPAFVGRRQQHFDCRTSVRLAFAPRRDGEEAGLTVYMNERFHYEIAVARICGERKLVFRRRIGSLWKVEHEAAWSADSVVLTVKADSERYEFFYAAGEAAAPVAFGQGEAALLATEVAGGFTGVFLAMYATGSGVRSESPAQFDWFDYEVSEQRA